MVLLAFSAVGFAALLESDSNVDLFPRQLPAFADAENWCTHLM